MAQYRPAGLSDEDSDSDEYGIFDEPKKRHYSTPQPNPRKTTEINLQAAIINGNITEVQTIIENDLHNDVNLRLDSGWTPLMHACFHAQDKIVELLLEMGSDPNLPADSVTPVMTACSNNSAHNDTIYNIITMLIDKNCILNIGDKYGHTPLMRAITSGQVAVVQLLLDKNVNIEMRDRQGWTALFWAVHSNQPEILEMLISHGARVNEVDSSGRTILDIALSHDYEHIIETLNQHLKRDDEVEVKKSGFLNTHGSWYDYYPGIKSEEKPNYSNEIPNLLYGMNCEQISAVIMDMDMDLRTFLLLEEDDMIKMGIDLPYERQRLKIGLRNFHIKGWKLGSVAGLYARNLESYSALDCLSALGSHLQQAYILEASLQYTLREYNKVHEQLKFEPPDSPVVSKLKDATKKMFTHMNSIRREIKIMKTALTKISKNNPQPADYIKDRSTSEIIVSYIPEVVVLCSFGFFAYQARSLFTNFFNK